MSNFRQSLEVADKYDNEKEEQYVDKNIAFILDRHRPHSRLARLGRGQKSIKNLDYTRLSQLKNYPNSKSISPVRTSFNNKSTLA